MTISSADYTITTTRSIVVPVDNAAEEVHFHSSSGIIYIGGADVTSSNGYKMDSTDKLQIPVGDNEALYGITASGTHTVAVLKQVN